MLGTVAVLGPIFFWLYERSMPALYDRSQSEPSLHAYPAGDPAYCAPGSRPGPAGSSPREKTADGIGYLVRTPANYDATRAHPLVVVYAPHGANRFLSERYVGLTHSFTREGFVVAYADHRGIEQRALAALGRLPAEIVTRWCVDERRIFLTGHSDGGTTATALVVLGLAKPIPAAIAPSAAGFRGEDLAAYTCPAPLPVLIFHSKEDELFPGYGGQAAAWWARCNRCGISPEVRFDGCEVYASCDGGAETMYCPGRGPHIDWPRRNDLMIDFFRSVGHTLSK